MLEFGKHIKDKYGMPTAENLDDIVHHARDVMAGHSMNKTFGVAGGGRKYFDPTSMYLGTANRKGGRMIDASTVEAGRKHLLDTAKMRGVQWGNSVTDDERLHHLSRSAEALADLADVTGLPDHAVSLGGTLGLAIGARGKGLAAAHYEPGTKVINLTRKNGVGTLAHEWGHALDHYISGGGLTTDHRGKQRGDYLSGARSVTDGDEVRKAMAGVKKAMADSGFDARLRDKIYEMMRSGELPRTNTPGESPMDYWGSPHEKFARVFEKHLRHKLEQEGRQNTYLTADFDHGLWPTREESAKLAPAMDALMAAIRAKHFADNRTSEKGFSGIRVVAGWHQKHGTPTHTVVAEKRFDPDRFKDVTAVAKRLGGNYINGHFARQVGAVPGFQFADLPTAERFADYLRIEALRGE